MRMFQIHSAVILAVALHMGCPAPRPSQTSAVGAPPGSSGYTAAARRPTRRPPARSKRTAVCPGGLAKSQAIPPHIRRALPLAGGFRLLVSGVRASELPLCGGLCPAPRTILALLDPRGRICWKVHLPAEHRMGPAGHRGKTLWVAGPRRVFAVSWRGKLLASPRLDRARLGLVALANGGMVTADSAGRLVAFRANGAARWKRKPRTSQPMLALHHRPGGGVSLAFSDHLRAYDVDGVLRLLVRLPDQATARGVAGKARSLWVWSARGAFRVAPRGTSGDGGRIAHRLPPSAPANGRIFSATLGQRGTLYALVAFRGLYPVRMVAVSLGDVLSWSRPFSGSQATGCQISLGPGEKPLLGLVCPNGWVAVRDSRGITRFHGRGKAPRLSLGPGGRYAVAFQVRSSDMRLVCWVQSYGPKGAAPLKIRRRGKCGTLWHDGAGHVYLDHLRLDR